MGIQTIIIVAALLISIVSVVHLLRYKKMHQELNELIIDKVENNEDLRKTLAMGLYLRFKKEDIDDGNNAKKYTELFIKQDPIAFEHFVADIFQRKFGGDVYVSSASGDFGVDIENRREEGQYFIQVKCYKSDLCYEPIALLHSNMVKYNAVGGYLVTTSDFNDNARNYADGLDITLINGEELVNMWLEILDEETELLTNNFKPLNSEI